LIKKEQKLPVKDRNLAKKRLAKTAMAKKMKTSRSAIDRLLDPENESVTLQTMKKAASVLGRKLKLELM
jgi:antitoxin HicB